MQSGSQAENKRSSSSSPLERRLGREACIAIFDIGKTNKKLFLLDEQYKPVYEQSQNFEETKDEDGFPCEDVDALSQWISQKFREVAESKDFNVLAVNFSGYGASMVHLDDGGKPITPLYNYLKPFPEKLKEQFYGSYGGESTIAKQTASPVLGNLNSGLQLYRLKYEQPGVYERIKHTLHLPQYLSFIVSANLATDITSIGCHTHLWDFRKHAYHDWVNKEGLQTKFPTIYDSDTIINIDKDGKKIAVGIGLHDSSAALIPYLESFTEPFILLSTGTWCITLNPFNHSLLSDYELHQDCLCYLSYRGQPVKASRLFAGYEHEQQVKRLAEHYHKTKDYYTTVKYDTVILEELQQHQSAKKLSHANGMVGQSGFGERDLNDFENYEAAYHQLILDIILQQVQSTKIVLNSTPVKRIFVDGGFGRNPVYMHLLAAAFPDIEIFAASIPQASAFGAALAIHERWNNKPTPDNLISLTHFKAAEHII